MNNRYLITGGAGFLGINLVRYLLEKKCFIRIIDIADFNYPEKEKIETVRSDIRDFKALSEAAKNIDIIIHAAAALPLYKKKDIFSTDITGTRNVLEAAFLNKIKRVIHISSTAVYGIPGHHPIYENDKLTGTGPYGEAKILAEKECIKYRQKGICIPILRPKSFIGPERLGVFAILYDWAKEKKNFPILGKGENRYQLLDVEDLCAAIYLCATKDQNAVNDTFNIGAKVFSTIKKDFQAVLDCAGYGKKIISFPALPLIFLLRFLNFFRLSPIYKWIYQTILTESFVSIQRAEKALNFKPRYSNQDALLRNYKWYLKNINNSKKKPGVSHRTPWNQGILKILKIFF